MTLSRSNLIPVATALTLLFAASCRGQAQSSHSSPPPPVVRIEEAPQPPPPPAEDAVIPMMSEQAPQVSKPVRDVIRLAQGGFSDDVLLAYISKLPSGYSLTPDEILYLRDLGLSEEVITGFISHGTGVKVSAEAPPAALAPEPAPWLGEPVQDPAPQAVEQVLTPPPTQVTYNTFYSSLAPYGTWVETPDYGRCWRPTIAVVNVGWRPYHHGGRWVWSDAGWYWHSDYSWGWAPFHYGRWTRHTMHGWVWVPDTVWGPSWVTWRYADAYCGWAPLPPRTYYRTGLGLTYIGSSVSVSFDFGIGHDYYTFVPSARFCDWRPWRYYVPRTRVANIYNQTTIVNNYYSENNVIVNKGIDPDVISRASRSEIRKVSVREASPAQQASVRPDRLRRDGSDVVVYRPPGSSLAAAPAGGTGRDEPSKSMTKTEGAGRRGAVDQPVTSAGLSRSRIPVSGNLAENRSTPRSEVLKSDGPLNRAAMTPASSSQPGLVQRPAVEGRSAAGRAGTEPQVADRSNEPSLIRTPVQRGQVTGSAAAPSLRAPQETSEPAKPIERTGVTRRAVTIPSPVTTRPLAAPTTPAAPGTVRTPSAPVVRSPLSGIPADRTPLPERRLSAPSRTWESPGVVPYGRSEPSRDTRSPAPLRIEPSPFPRSLQVQPQPARRFEAPAPMPAPSRNEIRKDNFGAPQSSGAFRGFGSPSPAMRAPMTPAPAASSPIVRPSLPSRSSVPVYAPPRQATPAAPSRAPASIPAPRQAPAVRAPAPASPAPAMRSAPSVQVRPGSISSSSAQSSAPRQTGATPVRPGAVRQ